MVLARLDEDERARVREEMLDRLRGFEAPGGIELPAVSLVVTSDG